MANVGQLEFLESMTPGQFKAEVNAETVEVLRNPKTNKLFFAAGRISGAVAAAGVPAKPMFSRVKGDDGQEFWLLHEKGEGAEVVATL